MTKCTELVQAATAPNRTLVRFDLTLSKNIISVQELFNLANMKRCEYNPKCLTDTKEKKS